MTPMNEVTMVERSQVPDEFAAPRDLLTAKQLAFIERLIDERDLLKSPRFFDATNAMDVEELAMYIAHLKTRAAGLNRKAASGWIEALLELPKKPAPTRHEVGGVPAGRYAVDNEEGELRFYRVDYGKKGGKWEGFCFLSVQHGPDESPVKGPAKKAIIEKIAADPREAAIRYGHEIGACCICGKRLTHRLSRELGIGPICGGRFWEPSDWKRVKRDARERIEAEGFDPDEEIEGGEGS